MKKTAMKKLAANRILKLFNQAQKRRDYADRYVDIARKIAMKALIRIPIYLKRRFCRHCYTYFNSSNSRFRTRNKTVIIYCRKCKKYTRIPFETTLQ